MQGMSNRMGQISKQNVSFSPLLLKRYFGEIERRIHQAETEQEKHDWIILSTYSVVAYVISLRGNEGFLIDLNQLIKNWKNHDPSYVIIPLMGKLKGDNHEVIHKFPSTNITQSGINVRFILDRAMKTKKKFNFTDGPLISDINGYVWSSQEVDEMMSEVLETLFEGDRSMFPINITSVESISESYKCFRSFRRTSDTRALEQKVSELDITIVNRWRVHDKLKKGKKASQSLIQHYSDFDKLLQPFLRYTKKM